MATAALVGAADFNEKHFKLQSFDFTVAVDRGWLYFEHMGMQPSLALGDFDSLGYAPRFDNIERHPSVKNESDMELACRTAVERGHSELVLYGCLGQRIDHTLANIQVMVGWARKGVRCWAVDDNCAITVLHGGNALASLEFDAAPVSVFSEGAYGNYISAFAFGGPARDVTETGLKYQLDRATLPDDASLGLSNEFTGRPASVRVGSGNLVVSFPLAAWDFRSIAP